MATVSVVDASSPLGTATVLVGAYSGPGGVHLAAGAEAIDASLGGQLLAGYRAAGGNGQPDEVIKIATLGLAGFPLVIVTGLGPAADPAEPGAGRERLRRAVAAGIRAVSATARVRVCVQPADPADQLAIAALAQGAKLGSYRFLEYKTKTVAIALKTIEVAVARPDRAVTAAVRRALIIAEAIMMARDLVNTPPNDLYPQSFATEIERRSAGVSVELEVLAEDELARQGYLGLLAVGGGSVRAPRLVRLSYRPARPRARVALVGQGTTFNAGGLNLKTVQMSWTKSDLAGAAAAAAAVIAAARMKLPVEVTATMPMAENLPSGTSYRPSDIVTLRGGRTVEVSDTDASGRLTVAEAIGRGWRSDRGSSPRWVSRPSGTG
jgi:leucyl aminopeptidase